MDAREFLGLRETHNPLRGTLHADASRSRAVRPWSDAKLASLAAVRDQDRRRTRPV